MSRLNGHPVDVSIFIHYVGIYVCARIYIACTHSVCTMSAPRVHRVYVCTACVLPVRIICVHV